MGCEVWALLSLSSRGEGRSRCLAGEAPDQVSHAQDPAGMLMPRQQNSSDNSDNSLKSLIIELGASATAPLIAQYSSDNSVKSPDRRHHYGFIDDLLSEGLRNRP